MRADLTDDAVANMDLPQGHATLEAHCGNSGPRGVAGHAIRSVRAFANGMPSTFGVGHVPRNSTGFDMLHEHDCTGHWLASRVHDHPAEVRGELASRSTERQKQDQGKDEGSH